MSDDAFETLDGESPLGFTSLPEGVRQVGPYRLISEIGRGAMGTVYRAEHEHLSRCVALKVLPEELAASPDRFARFQREMQAIGRLEHPNIVLATDAGQIDGVCYIAMQLIEGVDLAELISQRERLPVGEACEVVRQVALGLGEIDKHGMIHRDIKPSNLLLASNGEVKILDLGIASLRHTATRSDSLTMTGSFLGTPDYVAPEQISTGTPVDIRADIYSLGCTVYHLLSGRAPFSGPGYKSLPAKLLGHAEKEAEPLDQMDAGIPIDLAQLVARMMAKAPADRFGSPAEVADVLRSFCDSQALDQTAKQFGEQVRAKAKAVVATTASASVPRELTTNLGMKRAWISLAAILSLLVGWSVFHSLSPDHPADKSLEQQARSKAIASSVGKIKSDTRTIAENTNRMALTLEQMQTQFQQVVSKINEDPQTPSQWYANAIIHAKSGNQVEARRSYLKFFQWDLNVVDPYQSFATLLRLQEGAASAAEIFAALPGDTQLSARRLAAIGLRPKSEHRDALEAIAKEHPDFGPVYFEVSQTYIAPEGARLTLAEKLKKKASLLKYVISHEQGSVLKFYLDQSLAERSLSNARSQLLDLMDVNQDLFNAPITMTPELILKTGTWKLNLHFAEDARVPQFRDSGQVSFRPIVSANQLSMASGDEAEVEVVESAVSPNVVLWLGQQEDTGKVEIRYQDRHGNARGPFQFTIDLRKERIEAMVQRVNEMGHQYWVTSMFNRISFPVIKSGFPAVKLVKYGVNQESLDRQLVPLTTYPTSIKDNTVVMKEPIRFVTFQVIFQNGEESEVYRYEPKAEND
ncbi:MAG: serine/threonine-protein kinase [Pirellulaceae bacterium]